ncbi:MAG: hypothetical protein WD229_07415, partial [Pirellulales bacterium]
FANVSNSVRNRRATIEMSGQLRHLRNVLQQDLQGATCPGVPWQRSESNVGYIEIIEGQYREGNASNLIDGAWPPTATNPEIDHTLSTIPTSNLPLDTPSAATGEWVTDAAGLGDSDDVLMLTTRNEHEPFIGRMPTNARPDVPNSGDESNPFHQWGYQTIESTLAEVVWYAVENPGYTDDPDDPDDGETDPSAEAFFGEPGMRTIYRRTLLIAPWINPYSRLDNNGREIPFMIDGDRFMARPGLVRILRDNIERDDLERALAALVAFQERYDLSVRLEFDPNLGDDGRYVILANTLGDLTKRENRYEHYSFRPEESASVKARRDYPYAALSMGRGYSGSNPKVICWPDAESPTGAPNNYDPSSAPFDEGQAHLQDVGRAPNLIEDVVVAYTLINPFPTQGPTTRQRYKWRPFAYVDGKSEMSATSRVMLNDEEVVVRIIHGLVPLSGERRGEDVMMTGVLAFDLRLYDPGAPLFATRQIPGDRNSPLDVVVTPSDPGWRGMPPDGAGGAYLHDDNMRLNFSGKIGTDNRTFPYVSQGAYVDLGYGYDDRFTVPLLPIPDPATTYHPNFASSAPAWFFVPRGLTDVLGRLLAPGYAVYDTWSFHYENNGVNEDLDETLDRAWRPVKVPLDPLAIPQIDEGTNGLDDWGHYSDGTFTRLGVDDVGERETAPPYDKPLRGVQVLVRSYEGDSRAIRQVRVNQHFMPE